MTKTFGLVLGLIGFLWIGAVMAVLAMEINVVLARRLWPRALLTPFTDKVSLTEADRRAYASYARMQRHKGFERVSVSWETRHATEPTASFSCLCAAAAGGLPEIGHVGAVRSRRTRRGRKA